jgi:hypothetical protein
MRSFVYDTQSLRSDGPTTFFTDDHETEVPSAGDWTEEELLGWLLTTWQFRIMLFEELGMSEQTSDRLSVTKPFLDNPNKKPGDIDLLLADPSHPEAAVVLETKRVKIRPGSNGPQTITKLASFEKGIRQANALLDCGFSRTYLTMIAVVDGRQARGANFLFRGLQSEAAHTVLETPNWGELREGVGILYVEVVQPVERSVREAGMISLAHLHAAQPREQSGELTDRVHRFFE